MLRGPVEEAIHSSLRPGDRLLTPSRGKPFEVGAIDRQGIVLLLGAGAWETRIPWEALEGVVPLLRQRGTVRIGSTYSTGADPNTLDAHLKQFVNRATAGWVAVVLERAGVVEIDRARPATVRLTEALQAVR